MNGTSSGSEVSMIVLRSSDDIIFHTTRQAMRLSNTINTMLESLTDHSSDGCECNELSAIPLSCVDSHSLQKLIEWCEHHSNDVTNENEVKKYEDLSEWDRNFLDISNEQLIQLVNAANFMDIEQLMDIMAKKVANMIKGKEVEEIRQMFGIVNDFSPEEEKQILRETAWADKNYCD